MKSVTNIIKRIKQLEFSALWQNHCKDPEGFIQNLYDLIELNEDGYITIYQNKGHLNTAYVMRDVLYIYHEDDIKEKRIIWEMPYVETKLIALQMPKGEKERSRAYLDYEPIDWQSVQEGPLSRHHVGNYPVGVILIYFTKAMKDFVPGVRKFIQFFISYLANTSSNYKKIVKAIESLFETFDDFDTLLNGGTGKVVTSGPEDPYESKKSKKPEVDYDYLTMPKVGPVKAVNKLPKLIERLRELKKNPNMCKRDTSRLDKIIEMIQLVEDTIKKDPSTTKMTRKQIMKSLEMNKDAFNTMLNKAQEEYDKLTIRPYLPNYRPSSAANNKNVEIDRKLDQLMKKHFTTEFLNANWLDFANAKMGTRID